MTHHILAREEAVYIQCVAPPVLVTVDIIQGDRFEHCVTLEPPHVQLGQPQGKHVHWCQPATVKHFTKCNRNFNFNITSFFSY